MYYTGQLPIRCCADDKKTEIIEKERYAMKNDRRVKYTKMVLKQSLLDLMHRAPIGKISVKDICEKADVNRGTFYTHYADPYDLLDQIENDLFNEILRSIETTFGTDGTLKLLTEICSSIAENGELCAVLFGGYGDKDFLSRILNIAHDRSIAEWKKIVVDTDIEKLELLYAYFSQGSAAIIAAWVKRGMKESSMEIALLIDKISSQGLHGFRGMA
jgi:AcrR family transcriptional regulator